jgi:NADH-quinone oxidoreductase subunit D
MIASDGSGKPLRVRARTPSFCNLQAIEHMAKDGLIADLVVVIATIDPVMGDVDR